MTPLRPARRGAHSLKRRLLRFLLFAIALAALLQGATAYKGAVQQADDLFDDHLQQVARSMRDGAPLGAIPEGPVDADDFELYVQIWGQDGTPLYRSAHSSLPPRAVLGFSEVTTNGSRYRVYSLQTSQQTVQIAQDLSDRSARARQLALRATLPFALLTPLLMLAVWWIIRRSLAPIERARQQVASRAFDDLSPLPSTGLPDEVRPLVDELNLLFDRVRHAFDAQKNFVADAAHELRSPLTALKLQAQALRGTGAQGAGGVQGEETIDRLNQGIDRAIRLVEQLLVLAREEASPPLSAALGAHPAQPPADHTDLNDLIRLAVADVMPQATLKQIDLGLTSTPLPGAAPARVAGAAPALRLLLRNLLDNAVKYTPEHGQIDLTIEARQGTWEVTVEDSGPGMAAADRDRAFDRFFRASDVALQPGSGLGLAIVKTIADKQGAAVQLGESARLGGLKVTLRLAPDAPTTALRNQA